MEQLLKACPLCGANAELRETEMYEDDEGYYSFDMFYVKCSECEASTQLEYLENDAIESWNRGKIEF